MNIIAKASLKIRKGLKDLRDGKIVGFTSGFESLDRGVGRMEAGQVWLVGGYTGTGKSYFILNMIDGIIDEGLAKMAIFSTELSIEAYVKRHVLMRSGLFDLQFRNNPKKYYEHVNKVMNEYVANRITKNDIDIFGDITTFEQIEKSLKEYDLDKRPNIIFVDYMQELSIKGKQSEKDAMPILAKEFKKLAGKYKVTIVLVSQINNGAQSSGDVGKLPTMPFSHGKEVGNTAHTAILLSRKKLEDKSYERILTADVVKARNGSSGNWLKFEILNGYKLLHIKKTW